MYTVHSIYRNTRLWKKYIVTLEEIVIPYNPYVVLQTANVILNDFPVLFIYHTTAYSHHYFFKNVEKLTIFSNFLTVISSL